jgi:hypothetical protein
MENKKHIVIFSHGFGVRKDDRGLLSAIMDGIPEVESILFDYNEIDEGNNTMTVRPFSVQTKMLTEVIEKTRKENREATIDIIAHSQGCQVASLAHPLGIRKTILLAPSFKNDVEHLAKMFQGRPGTEINISWVSRLARLDGTITIVPAEFWEERSKIIPIPLFNNFCLDTEIVIINARQDSVLGKEDIGELDSRIKIMEIGGDHNFSGENRKNLVKVIRSLILE